MQPLKWDQNVSQLIGSSYLRRTHFQWGKSSPFRRMKVIPAGHIFKSSGDTEVWNHRRNARSYSNEKQIQRTHIDIYNSGDKNIENPEKQWGHSVKTLFEGLPLLFILCQGLLCVGSGGGSVRHSSLCKGYYCYGFDGQSIAACNQFNPRSFDFGLHEMMTKWIQTYDRYSALVTTPQDARVKTPIL